jgi:UDP-N-acetylmuramate--alanine ligase
MEANDLSAVRDILLNSPRRINLIGVAGSGMSGIAGLLLELGHSVSGSDRVSTLETRRLEGLGLDFHLPQLPETVHGADLVIYSSAIRQGNAAYDEALRLNLPRVRRAEALAAIMSSRAGIIIAGMHGKTTTSAMAAHVLRVGGLSPSHYVGAEIPILGTNAHWDPKGNYFVAEGDESDGTLRLYHPRHAIVLNVEEEHLDYYRNLSEIEQVFEQLMDQTSGLVIYCADDRNTAQLCHSRRDSISYGESEGAMYQARNIQSAATASHFQVWKSGKLLGAVDLGIPGRHNVSNALAVIALATELEVPFSRISEALGSFRGARRRFEPKLQDRDFAVFDDYGHHPTEIKATLEMARGVGSERIVVMFQPHRYSRTKALRNQFGAAFDGADLVYVTEVYPASEDPIPGVSGATLVEALHEHGHPAASYIPVRKTLHRELARIAKKGDLILSLGAGDIHEEASKLVRDLETGRALRETMGTGDVRLYEPMSRHTTLRVGGPAQFWLEPDTRSGLANLLGFCSANRLPVMVVGRGSNLLVRDGGIPGCVIHLARGDFGALKINGTEIDAGAGVRLKQLVGAARNAGIGGFEWMEGIPGSVGGSLRMNAGAIDSETFQKVLNVQVVNLEGQFELLTPDRMEIRYRYVPTLREQFAVSAVFKGEPSSITEIDRKIRAAGDKRKRSQPVAASAGCIFKNPAECPAGRLVDELGLKNQRIGGARVSEIHGNFIVNDDGAGTARDVLALIAEIRRLAKQQRGIELELEVEVVGTDDEFY